jgi:uncharacterized membrane protein
MEPHLRRNLGSYEALSQGVFAIAITLLALEIHIPDAAGIDSGAALAEALIEGWPRYFAYLLGFLYIGTYWLGGVRTLHFLGGADHNLMLLGLLTLMGISTVPFVTSLLAEYIGRGDGRDQLAVLIFTAWSLAVAVFANLLLQYAARRSDLLRPGISQAALGRWMRLALVGAGVWAVALLIALFASATVTLIVDLVVLLLFMVDVSTGDKDPELAPAGE